MPIKPLLEMERSLQAQGRGVGYAFQGFHFLFLCFVQ